MIDQKNNDNIHTSSRNFIYFFPNYTLNRYLKNATKGCAEIAKQMKEVEMDRKKMAYLMHLIVFKLIAKMSAANDQKSQEKSIHRINQFKVNQLIDDMFKDLNQPSDYFDAIFGQIEVRSIFMCKV